MLRKILLVSAFLLPFFLSAADIEKWTRYEATYQVKASGNPFGEVTLTADFTHGARHLTVTGFYDGNGTFRLRFMPDETGEWTFVTRSNLRELSGKKGRFTCTEAAAPNHGPVKVSDTYHFRYADGKAYYPFGTTLYAWTHQSTGLEELTLTTLKGSGFNKVRMCVFPKYYTYAENEPPFYPYPELPGSKAGARRWDFSRFDPRFFQHLEKRIDDLRGLGIEADLILFHPYDKGHWGFDSLSREANLRYISYLVARLSSFRNVWWSMANEWDYVKSKSHEEWDAYSQAVVAADPYRHLCSIHNGSVYFEYWKPAFTHVSIQNGAAVEEFGRANLVRDAYFKPVIYDEVCYEGNLPQRWGQLSGEEMTHAFWQAIIAGTYATHGETFLNKGDTVFWAKGGRLTGTSPARIRFLRGIMEEGPGPVQLADEWKDVQTATAGKDYYLVYFGKQLQAEWPFNLPKKNGPDAGTRYRVDLIDTWNMTITPLPETFEAATPEDYRIFDRNGKKIRLPLRPYFALRIRKI